MHINNFTYKVIEFLGDCYIEVYASNRLQYMFDIKHYSFNVCIVINPNSVSKIHMGLPISENFIAWHDIIIQGGINKFLSTLK